MKPANTHNAPSIRQIPAALLLGILAAAVITVACSTKPSRTVISSVAAGPSLRPAALQRGGPGVEPAASVAASEKSSSLEKPSPSKSILYRSRDYGVSFLYPWQYAFFSARTVANGDPSLWPKSDGHDGQFTLARIEIPRGFYSGTDYESGYFTFSLNQNLNKQECESSLGLVQAGKTGTDTINGVEFRWLETDSGGHGHAAKLRQYVTFTNSTCYELETGVKTRNDDGLAREVDPDQVLRRLDTILRTVRILAAESPAPEQTGSSTAVPASVSHN